MAEQKSNTPLPLGVAVGEDVIGTSRTTEVRKLGEKFVLKELKKVEALPRIGGETDEQYRARRLKRSMEILREERELAEVAKEFIPSEVVVHEESFLITDGSDGFPTPYKVQPLSEGKTLRRVEEDQISEQAKMTLDRLVAASIRCFLKTGKVFDIVGCVLGDSDSPLEDVMRHLNPMKFSSNVLLLDDSRLAFIDARVGGGSPLVQAVSFMTLAGYYWNRVVDKIKKPKTVESREQVLEQAG